MPLLSLMYFHLNNFGLIDCLFVYHKSIACSIRMLIFGVKLFYPSKRLTNIFNIFTLMMIPNLRFLYRHCAKHFSLLYKFLFKKLLLIQRFAARNPNKVSRIRENIKAKANYYIKHYKHIYLNCKIC